MLGAKNVKLNALPEYIPKFFVNTPANAPVDFGRIPTSLFNSLMPFQQKGVEYVLE